ncbi:MAG TPA: UDP-N-acetylmuramate dehydrogenase [Candidatus Binatia bacterium]|nr:UDP-N-acetylmuramate dehydrogenase [Candidatus Binatia bacterium]
MQIQKNIPLAQFSTMRLGGNAAYLIEVNSRQDVSDAVAWAIEQQLPPLMIGGGSNIFWRDEGFNGLVLVNKIMGYKDFEEDELNHYITIGAGEIWDKVVERTVESGLTGIEALSLIPGTTGATPIQNVGAYGQEIAETLVSVEAYDLKAQKFLNLPNEQCGFGYRTSRFKTTDRDRFLITGLVVHLTKSNPEPPFYAALQTYLDTNKIHDYTPATIRQATIAIRQAKLPDPSVVANNGSFFANPIINSNKLAELIDEYPDMPHWLADKGAKLPAAWLLEKAGFKDFHDPETGMATWPKQTLVLINEHAKSTSDLLKFKQKIVDAVQTKFGIKLEQEPEMLP